MDFISKTKLKFYTKEFLKFFNITIISLGFIIAIILIKYKPAYKVSIEGEELGYIENKTAFEESLKEEIKEDSRKNIEEVTLNTEPVYELKLVNRTEETNEEQNIEEIKEKVKEDMTVTYKYYEIALENNVVETVNTSEEAEKIVSQIKEEKSEEEVNLTIQEKYTTENDVQINDIETAKLNVENKVEEKIEEELESQMPDVNGIKLAVLPITGQITSRYGVSSNIRKSTHTGLDIAASTGTPIKVMADGVVTEASYNGSYGNLIKVAHGNNVETWYAHTSKMYVTKGQEVKAGDIIGAVGSTGNSTGPHLHLEIRVNNKTVNPQNYVYK